ncbi:MAG: hypothetical protein HY553_02430 [Elusimicrobia bacterium]|nr:hypothetical protein [Elusimicrobiota bacterium]
MAWPIMERSAAAVKALSTIRRRFRESASGVKDEAPEGQDPRGLARRQPPSAQEHSE